MDNASPNSVCIIRPSDDDWRFTLGMIHYPRASIVVDVDCPEDYKDIILMCMSRGWIKPIAYMKESEYVWEKLQQL